MCLGGPPDQELKLSTGSALCLSLLRGGFLCAPALGQRLPSCAPSGRCVLGLPGCSLAGSSMFTGQQRHQVPTAARDPLPLLQWYAAQLTAMCDMQRQLPRAWGCQGPGRRAESQPGPARAAGALASPPVLLVMQQLLGPPLACLPAPLLHLLAWLHRRPQPQLLHRRGGVVQVKSNALEDEGVAALCLALTEREAPMEVLDLGNNRRALCCPAVLGSAAHGETAEAGVVRHWAGRSGRCPAVGSQSSLIWHGEEFDESRAAAAMAGRGAQQGQGLRYRVPGGLAISAWLSRMCCSATVASAEALARLIARGDLSDLNLNGNSLGDDAMLQAQAPSWRLLQ